MSDRPAPPRLAVRLLEWRLPEELVDAISGDLQHEFGERIDGGQGRYAAAAWFWAQALTIRAGRLRRAWRRVRVARPSAVTRSRGTGMVSWLDVKLGLRMLPKHPVTAVAAIFALSVGIPAAMVPMQFSDTLERPIPEDDDDRIRSVRYWDVATAQPVAPTYFELAEWQDGLTSFEAIGAVRSGHYSLPSEDDNPAPILGAEVTASTFEVLGTAPFLGRTFTRDDEREGTPGVVVVGYDLWRTDLGGDRDVIGTTLRVGGVPRTIVGVMPEGFLFPVRQQLWLPLREERLVEPALGRGLQVFGRLADGMTPDMAQSELTAFGLRMAAEFPESHARLRAEVVSIQVAQLGVQRGGWTARPESILLQAMCLVLLLVACANVGMLIFARTATRLRELAIRTALGASRLRIVSQVFVESLVLAVCAAGLGLLSLGWMLGRIPTDALTGDWAGFPPYWFDLGATGKTVLRAGAAAVFSATVAGVLPALKITGTKVQRSIQRTNPGSSGIRFGRVTGALIIADVAMGVAVVGLAVAVSSRVMETSNVRERVGIAAEEYLAVEIALPPDGFAVGPDLPGQDQLAMQLAVIQEELLTRLESEPRVRSVAVADQLPRQEPNWHRVSVVDDAGDGAARGDPNGSAPPYAVMATVAVDYFEALGQPTLSGRGFGQVDLQDGISTAIVNRSFVDRRMAGRNPIGRRIRLFPEERSYEIVGVVGDLGMNVASPSLDAGIYVPGAPGEIQPLRMAIHLDGPPETFAPRLRALVTAIDPRVVIHPPMVLDRARQVDWYVYVGTTVALALVLGILVALAASGIYAIMSFAVAERTREIGIRAALGAQKRTIAADVARRALLQVGAGALLGVGPAVWLSGLSEIEGGATRIGFGAAFAGGVGVALVVGLLACLWPMRRALSIEPTEALRGEA